MQGDNQPESNPQLGEGLQEELEREKARLQKENEELRDKIEEAKNDSGTPDTEAETSLPRTFEFHVGFSERIVVPADTPDEAFAKLGEVKLREYIGKENTSIVRGL